MDTLSHNTEQINNREELFYKLKGALARGRVHRNTGIFFLSLLLTVVSLLPVQYTLSSTCSTTVHNGPIALDFISSALGCWLQKHRNEQLHMYLKYKMALPHVCIIIEKQTSKHILMRRFTMNCIVLELVHRKSSWGSVINTHLASVGKTVCNTTSYHLMKEMLE